MTKRKYISHWKNWEKGEENVVLFKDGTWETWTEFEEIENAMEGKSYTHKETLEEFLKRCDKTENDIYLTVPIYIDYLEGERNEIEIDIERIKQEE